VGVVCIVGGIAKVLGNTIAEDESINLVVDIVGLVLVECEQNNRPVVVEVRIHEQRRQPILEPVARKIDRRVVTVVDHIGRDEHPLRQRGRIHVRGKVVEVTVPRQSLGDADDGIVKNRRVVLPDIVGIWRSRSIQVVGRRVAVSEKI
jgi:hypothetical protein